MSQYIYFLAENLLHEISKLRISAVSSCHGKFFVFLERRSTCSEQKDNAMRQMVAYLGLKTYYITKQRESCLACQRLLTLLL